MEYCELVNLYGKLDKTSSRLEKVKILSDFLKKIAQKKEFQWIYLFKGRVLPDYDSGEFGISDHLIIKALSFSFGIEKEVIQEKLRKIGDIGEIAKELAEKKKQRELFFKKLTIQKVFENLKKLISITGKGAIEKKINLIAELLSQSSGEEAKFIVRTLLSDLRIGIADGVIRDAICEAFFSDEKEEMQEKVEEAFEISGDFALVFKAAATGKRALEEIDIVPGKPVRVMLAIKVADLEEAFEVCGKKVALEYKYDGFRMIISKKDKEIKLFTRKLEDVSLQFPDVLSVALENVKGDSFVLDSEVVGFNPDTKEYMPFEAISQRIKRKYEIENLVRKLPVEVNVFDILYYNGKSTMKLPFIERRRIIEKIVKAEDFKIKPSVQIITDDINEAREFYENALRLGKEGVMIKNLDAPYKQGRRVGYMVKLKPTINELDLVIVGAEYGSGKRGGLLTSYIVACRDDNNFLEIGKVSSGLKEKEEGKGTTYEEMTFLLKPLILEEKESYVRIKPKVVVSVTYQNIQKSPSYSSGYALRFPRILNFRPDRDVTDIASLDEIKKIYNYSTRKKKDL